MWNWVKRQWKKFLIAVGIVGIVLAAPVMPVELKWVVSYETVLFDTSSGDLAINEYAEWNENGLKGYYVRLKKDGDFERVDGSYNITGLKKVNVIGKAYYDEFAGRKGEIVRVQSNQAAYRELGAKNAAQPVKFEFNNVLEGTETRATISLNATSSARGGGSSRTFSHTCLDTETYMVAQTSVQDSNHTNFPITGVTYNGSALSEITSVEGTSNVGSEIWAYAPGSDCDNSAHNVVVSSTGSLGELAAGVSTWFEVDSTGVTASTPENQNNSDPDCDFTTSVDNSWTICGVTSEANITGTDPGIEFLWGPLTDQSFENAAGSYEGPITPAGTNNMDWDLGFGAGFVTTGLILPPSSGAAAATGGRRDPGIIFFE